MEIKITNRILILFISAAFVSVTNALPLGALPGWSGSVPFDYAGTDGRSLSGYVDYAVYNVGDYTGTAPSEGNYVYAYQVFNAVTSDVCIESFSVCLLEGVDVGDIYADSFPDSIEPFAKYFSPDEISPDNASFLFLPAPFGAVIGGGEKSFYLVFSSNDGPMRGFGHIEGGAIGGTEVLPTPVPEPMTIVLLGAGGLTGFVRRRRSF